MKKFLLTVAISLLLANNGWCLSISDPNALLLNGSDVGAIDFLLNSDTKTFVDDNYGGGGITNTEKEEAWVNGFLSSFNGDTATFYEIDKIETVPYYITNEPGVFAFQMNEPPVSDYFIIKNSQGYALYANNAYTNWGVFDSTLPEFISDLKLPTDSFTISHVTRSSGVAPVPEPGTIVLLGTGLLGLAGAMRKKMKK
jgi:hypothetical protein